MLLNNIYDNIIFSAFQHIKSELSARHLHLRETHLRETHLRKTHLRKTHLRKTHLRQTHLPKLLKNHCRYCGKDEKAAGALFLRLRLCVRCQMPIFIFIMESLKAMTLRE